MCINTLTTEMIGIIAIVLVNTEVQNIAYIIENIVYLKSTYSIPVIFSNGLNFDYHFIIKEPAKESKGELNCLEENSKNQKIFQFLQQKITRIKKGKKIPETMSLQVTTH